MIPRDDDFLEHPAAELAAPLFTVDREDEGALRARLDAALGDRYQVERELGRGGMATVLLARDRKHSRRVAIKVMHEPLSPMLGAERFRREIEVVAALSHPHILALHDSGDANGLPYFVMPYVEGESLRDRLRRDGRLDAATAARLTRELADALAYAHRHGIVHRDVKPENVLLADGHAVLSDFGIARASTAAAPSATLTATGATLGTPIYMSPEQAGGEGPVDGRSDLYSLGCVLYEMLVGEPPFTGPTVHAVIARRLTEQAPRVRERRPEVPAPLDALAAQLLARDPVARPETADAVVAHLDGIVSANVQWRGKLAAGPWRMRLALGALALLAAAGAAALWQRVHRGTVQAHALGMAVFPLDPVVPDSGLERLGRELAVTIGTTIDGVGGIRVADPMALLASTRAGDRVTLERTLDAARRLGASSVLHGSIARIGERARLDLVLRSVASGEPIARFSASGPMANVTMLSDSAAWALLDQVWRAGTPPTPSLAAVTTRSIPALRAFLDGERQVASSEWRAAATSFERAFTTDSAFWLAYWRYAVARDYWSSPVDSLVRARYREHRDRFPERDRALIEAEMSPTLGARYARTRAAAERFPEYWPAWWTLSERLAHDAPLVGTSFTDLRPALERTLALNPRMTPAWQHLFWVALEERDTLLADRVIAALTALRHDSLSLHERGFDELAHFRYLAALVHTGGVAPDSMAAEPGVRIFAAMPEPTNLYALALGNSNFGFYRAQIDQSRRVALRRPGSRMAIAQQLGIAVGEASRGAWDAALAALDAFVAGGDPAAPLYRYRVATVGAWLQAIAPTRATGARAAAQASASQLAPTQRAELAWLDGVLAHAARDRAAIDAAARRALAADTITGLVLARSLRALALEVTGRRDAATDSLVALERERADDGSARHRSDAHPFLTVVNRLAAARWLRDGGDAATSARLLTWNDAVLAPLVTTRQAQAMTRGLTYLERARSAAALGQRELARTYYQRFLWHYEAPPASHAGLVREARQALAR